MRRRQYSQAFLKTCNGDDFNFDELDANPPHLIRDIDLWEMKLNKKIIPNKEMQDNFVYRFNVDKLRNFKITDMKPSDKSLPQLNSKMIETILSSQKVNKFGSLSCENSGKTKEENRNNIKIKKHTHPNRSSYSQNKIIKTYEVLQEELNPLIINELIFRDVVKSVNEKINLRSKFISSFKSLQGVCQRDKFLFKLNEIASDYIQHKLPQSNFDFSKDIQNYRDTTYNTTIIIQSLQTSLEKIDLEIDEEKEKLIEMRKNYTISNEKLNDLNKALEEGKKTYSKAEDNLFAKILNTEPSQPEILKKKQTMARRSGAATYNIDAFQSTIGLHKINQQREELIKNIINAMAATSKKSESYFNKIQTLQDKIASLKQAKADAIKLIKEVFIFILESEKEHEKDGLKPIIKGFLDYNFEIPREMFSKNLDEEAIDYLLAVVKIECEQKKVAQKYVHRMNAVTNSARMSFISTKKGESDWTSRSMNEVVKHAHDKMFEKMKNERLSSRNSMLMTERQSCESDHSLQLKELEKNLNQKKEQELRRLFERYVKHEAIVNENSKIFIILKAEFGMEEAKKRLFDLKKEKIYYEKKMQANKTFKSSVSSINN